MTQMLIPEPTSNIAPKVPGKNYEGGVIVSAVNGSSIVPSRWLSNAL